jgi:hypothetical protein
LEVLVVFVPSCLAVKIKVIVLWALDVKKLLEEFLKNTVNVMVGEPLVLMIVLVPLNVPVFAILHECVPPGLTHG